MLTDDHFNTAMAAISSFQKKHTSAAHPHANDACILANDLLRNFRAEPIRSGTVFSNEFQKGFEELSVFHERVDDASMLRQIQFVLVFCYAWCFEQLLNRSEFGEPSVRVMHFIRVQNAFFAPEFLVRIELFQGKVIAGYRDASVDKTAREIDQKISILNKELTPMSEKVSEWEASLNGWKQRIEELEVKIKSEYERLNFVGLSEAFYKMLQKKDLERETQVKLMRGLGVALLLVPIFEVCVAHFMDIKMSFTPDLFVFSAPFFVTELILFYFFRIALRNFYSVKAQLLQLDLRFHVCAFIHGYSEFAKDARKENATQSMMDKFDNLIFSGITADIQNIPSQFDGVESIAAVIKELRGSRQ